TMQPGDHTPNYTSLTDVTATLAYPSVTKPVSMPVVHCPAMSVQPSCRIGSEDRCFGAFGGLTIEPAGRG
ncbi:hypothetical protein, partial [Blastomonas sp. CCH5-E3]|uniref:hypothetical protein n=1 Tax=Blastomonas sp. CCH5-E3 TaxID=1768750 RepID=UPI001E4FCF6F